MMLSIHSVARWLVLAFAGLAMVRAYSGWMGRRGWGQADRRAGLLFTVGVDIQLLIGLIVALLSPLVKAAFSDLGAAMAAGELRFFVAEHMPLMIVAVVLAHVSGAVSRMGAEDVAKHRRAAIGYTLTLLFILVAMPWWRPLLRLFNWSALGL
jgi:hypothetical protein